MIIKKGKGLIIFNCLGYSYITFIAVFCLIPFAFIISGSLTDEQSIYNDGYRLIPRAASLYAYQILFKAPAEILRAYGVTMALTVSGALTGLFITAMTAYVLQRDDFKSRNYFSFFLYFTTLFSGGLIAYYIYIVRYYRLKDSFWAMLLPPLLSVWLILIMRSFLKSIPNSITESAKMDGAGDFTIFIRLVLPLAIPGLASIGLFIAIGYWNDWYNAMLFIEDVKLFPLQYFLYRILNSVNFANKVVTAASVPLPEMPAQSLKLAMTVVVCGPIIFLYPFVQKYFIRGLTVGSVKG